MEDILDSAVVEADGCEPDDRAVEEIVEQLKAKTPGIRLFQIVIPDNDEIYLAKKAPWRVYKSLLGKIKDEAQANETLVQRFLVYPDLTYEQVQEMDPGTVMLLAGQIQKGMGFSREASLKNW